jgi:ADP-ribosyl-[dinitrogen reductase] hydrolase
MMGGMKDRCRGALIGLAVGDALGAAIEFRSPGSFVPVTGYRGGGPHGLEAGEWTDDTSMALALAGSLASAGWDLNDQATQYVDWWRTGNYSVNGRCFDIGTTTRNALSTFLTTNNALTSGETCERASGNGSIMRLAPVPIRYDEFYPDRIEELSRLAEESSLPTHASEQCRSACRYLGTVLAALIQGEDRTAVLAPDWKPLRLLNDIKPLHPLIQDVAQGSFRQKQPPDIQGSGWVVKSLEAALWAFDNADSFEQAVLRAVNLGDDADTTGAVCGQLAGAFWGESRIPESLRSGLARGDMLEKALAGLREVRTWSIDEPFLKASSNPSDDDLAQLRSQGFSVVISFLDEKLQPPRYNKNLAAAAGWVNHPIAIAGGGVPSLKQLSEFTTFVKSLPRGTKIVMHCESGLGRTASMAAAYWIEKGLSANEAIARVRQAAGDGRWITPQREGLLQEYARTHQGAGTK